MTMCIFLALLNGLVVGLGRSVNGQLSTIAGPFRASLWNHAVGFVFLTVMLLVAGWPQFSHAPIPLVAYLGGGFGALFVAINCYVFTRMGAMKAALLVISGQMLSAVLIDGYHQQHAPGLLRCLGVGLLLLGMYLSCSARAHPVDLRAQEG
jgi:transporter family-2 protein